MLYEIDETGYKLSSNGTYTLKEAKEYISVLSHSTSATEALYYKQAFGKLDKIAHSYGFKDTSHAILWANNDDINNSDRRPDALKIRAVATIIWNKIQDRNESIEDILDIETVIPDNNFNVGEAVVEIVPIETTSVSPSVLLDSEPAWKRSRY